MRPTAALRYNHRDDGARCPSCLLVERLHPRAWAVSYGVASGIWPLPRLSKPVKGIADFARCAAGDRHSRAAPLRLEDNLNPVRRSPAEQRIGQTVATRCHRVHDAVAESQESRLFLVQRQIGLAV